MGEALKYLAEHLLKVTLPLALGIIILILTYFRWLSKKR
ncbi:hypothetical protein ES703_113535 [subsurface metagenome]